MFPNSVSKFFSLFCLFFLLSLSVTAQANIVNGEKVTEYEWEQLMPDDWNFDSLFTGINDLNLIDDMDPKAEQIMDDLQQSLKTAPVRKDLDGKMIKLPGFVVPLEGQGENVFSFFLVPYFGACIHVPPPPANQIIHVEFEPGTKVENLYDAIWVTGKISVELTENDLGASGYSMQAFQIEPYDMSLLEDEYESNE